jgi:Protein of unknown function (DUF1670)
MGIHASKRWQPYAANERKTFHSALCRLLHTEFPGVFGPTITRLFADRIDELYDRFHPERSRLKLGQVLWTAVAVDDPPAQHKRIEDSRLLPVVLDLVTAQDISDAGARKGSPLRRRDTIVRLCRQAYAQHAVLSLADIALLLHVELTTVSKLIRQHERQTGESVPRRGTVHDLGRSVTHKAIICYKRLVEKKPTSQVAAETYHSEHEVEYYVQSFRRIQLCHDSGMSPEDTARATGHTVALVQEYLELLKQFGLPPLPTTPGKDGDHSDTP